MAIAGSLLKQAANIVGKAIKVTKKKKGQVGGKLKKQFKKEARRSTIYCTAYESYS